MPKKQEHRVKEKPGPKPEYLKINGDWKEAVKIAVQKKSLRTDGRRRVATNVMLV